MLMPSVFGRDLFDDFFGFPFYDNSRKTEKKLYSRGKNLMNTDVKEQETGYELEMDLPGFKKEEITAALKDGYLTIRAVKGVKEENQEQKKGTYIRRERFYGSCQRSFYVGEDVTEEDIKAKFEQGILTLFIPKKEKKPEIEEKKYIAIEG